MVICDTNVIIEYFKGNELTKKILNSILSEDIAVSVITLMELMIGALNKRELKKIKRAINSFIILQISEEISEMAITLIEKYSKSHGLKIPDALIAATAIYHNAKLWTYNVKDFHYIDGLNLLDFEKKKK